MITKRDLAGDPNAVGAGLNTAPTSGSTIRPARRGKHKIFIGMAPGVGKTYRMLEEAHLLKHEGIDVVIGVVETHGNWHCGRWRTTARKMRSPAPHLRSFIIFTSGF